jgi:hypothetical protein
MYKYNFFWEKNAKFKLAINKTEYTLQTNIKVPIGVYLIKNDYWKNYYELANITFDFDP